MGDYTISNTIVELNRTMTRIADALDILVEDKKFMRDAYNEENKKLREDLSYFKRHEKD